MATEKTDKTTDEIIGDFWIGYFPDTGHVQIEQWSERVAFTFEEAQKLRDFLIRILP